MKLHWKTEEKDKIENVKQQQKKQTLVLQKKIVLQNGHTVFEYNRKTMEIQVAIYEPPKTVIHWDEAFSLYLKKEVKKLDIYNAEMKTIAKIIERPNCIYISCLNKTNVLKILKRDYNINLYNQENETT